MTLPILLILFPLIPAVLVLFTRHGMIRNLIVTVSVLVMAAAAVWLLVGGMPEFTWAASVAAIMDEAVRYGGGALSLILCVIGFATRRFWIPLLVVPQAGFMLWLEFLAPAVHGGEPTVTALYADYFSLIMALIIAVIGGFIAFFALRYMREYHHADVKDRSNLFFSLFFLFFSAMFGIVFSNRLTWMLFFWEITTLASFLLIGYPGGEQARKNASRALFFNLVGGVAFAAAIGCAALAHGVTDLATLVAGPASIALAPAVLLCVAGFTKSAQFPFFSWLKGAMVAPTPVSALLHSSTMVKAGVFLVIKLSPVFSGTASGALVAMVGAFTFFFAAFIAISRRDAKEVLAYSTISNLGLIVLCAGVGTPEAIWAAILLLIFHAIAKALLFLCVGLVEQRIGSRDIESMDGLLRRMPKITYIMLIGIAGMFLAPFGMLISKWAALKALIDVHPILAVIVVFGGTATLFFWTKWMGKLTSVRTVDPSVEREVKLPDWIALAGLAAITIAVCVLFPLVSNLLVDPYLAGVYDRVFSMDQGNVMIMLVMLGMLLVLPVVLLVSITRGRRKMEFFYTDAYVSGTNTKKPFKFFGSMGTVKNVETQNYYFDSLFGEKRLAFLGTLMACLTLAGLGGSLFR